MGEWQKLYFPMFKQLRFRVGRWRKWIYAIFKIIFFLQTTFIALFSAEPSSLSGLTFTNSPQIHLLNLVLGIQWFSEQNFQIYNVILYLLLNLSCLGFIQYLKVKSDKNEEVPAIFYELLQVTMLFLTGPISVQLYFKIALVIDMLINRYTPLLFIPLVLILITCSLTIFIAYLNSVFIDPYDMSIRDSFDMLENKTGVMRQIVVCIQIVISFMMFSTGVDIANYVLVVITITIAVLDVYIRILPFNYVSIHYNFLDNAFTLTIPILSSIRVLTYINLLYYILICIVILIVLLLILKGANAYLIKKSSEMINIFLNSGHGSSFNSSTISPFNFVSMVRCAAIINPNPTMFERLIEMQHNYLRRGSIVIEIARGMGVFPSKRKIAIDEIDQTESKNIHNSFILYMIKERLSAIIDGSTKEDRDYILTMHRDFIDTMQRYWKARIKKETFSAIKEGVSGFWLGILITHESKILVEKFPFDQKVRKLYIECLMVSNSEATVIQNQINIMNELGNENWVTDPILHTVSNTHPNFLRYLDQNEIRQCSAATPMRLRKDSQGRRPVWSFISPGVPHYVPFFVLLYIIPCVVFLGFCVLVIKHEELRHELANKTAQKTIKTVYEFFLSESSMFFPFAHQSINLTVDSVNMTDQLQCQISLVDATTNLLRYYATIPTAETLVSFTVPVVTAYFHDIINETSDFCTLLMGFLNSNFSELYLNKTTGSMIETWALLMDHMEFYNDTSRYLFAGIGFPLTFIISGLLVVITCSYKLTHSFISMSKYFKFMASDERNDLLRQGKAAQSWDLLYDELGIENKEDEQKERQEDLSNSDDFDNVIQTKKKNYNCMFVLIYVSFWLANIIMFAIICVSHFYRMVVEKQNVVHLEQTFELTIVSAFLQNEIAKIVLGLDYNVTKINDMVRVFYELPDHIIYQAFVQDRLIGNETVSVYSLLLELIDPESFEKRGQEFWRDKYLPLVFQFTREAIVRYFANESVQGYSYDVLGVVIFCLQLSAWTLACLFIGIASSFCVAHFYSVIFQFPVRFIELYKPSETIENHSHSGEINADNVMVIRSVADTGAIYSVSQSAQLILGKRPESFINEPLDGIFVDTPGEVPLVSTTDKRNEKTFRVQHEMLGPIKRSLYVDDATKVMSGVSQETTITSKLTPFMPLYFAERFMNDVSTLISIENSHFIIIRLKDTTPQLTDRFYGTFSMVVNQFRSLRIVNMDCTLISCVLSDHMSRAEVILVTRDVIAKVGNMLHAVELVFVENADFEVIVEGEPFIDTKPGPFKDSEKRIYSQKEGTIALSKSLQTSSWRDVTEWEGMDIMSVDNFLVSAIRASS